jgi:hypothetical protein
VTPYQWSFPLNLPNQFFGITPAGELSATERGMPWADEIEQRLLLPPSIGVGDYARQPECAFFHKRSRTMILTDSVILINDNVGSREGESGRGEKEGEREREEGVEEDQQDPARSSKISTHTHTRIPSLLSHTLFLLLPSSSLSQIPDIVPVPALLESARDNFINRCVRGWKG